MEVGGAEISAPLHRVTRGKGYGYGSAPYDCAGCGIELAAATCITDTSGLVEGTIGAWWRFLHGLCGTMQLGEQYE